MIIFSAEEFGLYHHDTFVQIPNGEIVLLQGVDETGEMWVQTASEGERAKISEFSATMPRDIEGFRIDGQGRLIWLSVMHQTTVKRGVLASQLWKIYPQHEELRFMLGRSSMQHRVSNLEALQILNKLTTTEDKSFEILDDYNAKVRTGYTMNWVHFHRGLPVGEYEEDVKFKPYDGFEIFEEIIGAMRNG